MKIIRTSTVPESINIFYRDFLRELQEHDGYDVVVVSSPGDALMSIKQREKVRVYAVNMERRISILKDIKSLYSLIVVFRKERPTIVHSMTPKAGLLSMIAAFICRVPIRIHTFTGLIFPTAKGLMQQILILTDRVTCACATHIIPEGEGVKQDLIKYRITRKPLPVLGYGNIKGIDLSIFDPNLPDVKSEAEKIHKPELFTFIYVGRLVGDKGINELIKAFSQLHDELPKTRLLLIGREEHNLDPLRAETLTEIERNPFIESVGEQSDVRPWLVASDCFILPSYREGFPNVVIEAGAMGLPSIVTDINGSREIIINGQNGIIVPPKDVSALKEAMRNILLMDKATLCAMKNNARPLISSRFEQSFVRSCLKKYYTDVIAEIRIGN